MGIIVLASCGLCATCVAAQAKDVYISPDGGGTGICTNNVHPPSWFNNSANWGSGATQIGPGTTVHLCGTFTGSAGASGILAFQGSGTNGNPITLLFEPGAGFTAPYWGGNGAGGAIQASGVNYIVIDGGANGYITATANGTSLANLQSLGTGIQLNTVSNSEIKNMSIGNMYVHNTSNANDVNGETTYAIYWLGGSNNLIHDNTLHDAKAGLYLVYPSGTATSNISIYNNTVYNINWGIIVGDGGPNATLSSLKIYGNTIHDWVNWDTTSNQFHHDGIFVFSTGSRGSNASGVQIYNNYVYGDPGINSTAAIYISADAGAIANASVFNNVLKITGTHFWNDALAYFNGSPHTAFYNNTLIGVSPTVHQNGMDLQGASPPNMRNNIFLNLYIAIYFADGSATLDASNNNDFYGNGTIAVIHAGANYSTLAAWQASGYDSGSVSGNPNLTSGHIPSAGSPVIGVGANLTSLGITALNSDKAGVARPSGAWSGGAYQPGSSVAQQPNPPTGLTVTVN